jgi:uncharacterized protein
MTWLRQLALLLLMACANLAFAQDVLPVPALTARVMDQSATLSASDQQALEAKLAAFEAEAGSQLVVLMVKTTQPEDIASYAQRVGETWKIGRKGVGDGLLIVVAKDDRRIWITAAKALEGAVPDLAASHIIRDAIRPRFKQNDFAGGLSAGIDALAARIRDEKLPAPQSQEWKPEFGNGVGGLNPLELMIFGFVALPIVATVMRSLFGRFLGTVASAGVAGGLAWMLTQTLWLAGIGGFIGLMVGLFSGTARNLRSATRRHGGWVGTGGWAGGDWSGGGGGGGGGGFSSGGGGDFGGGGAGGDW